MKTKYKLFQNINEIDISEQDILDYDKDVFATLLLDHTMSTKLRQDTNDYTRYVNIFWATKDYEYLGDDYLYGSQILPNLITGDGRSKIIMPRVLKDKQMQLDRTKEKAEVFTPSWVCNAQNNLIDEAWFGRKEIFNREIITVEGKHTWISNEGKISFPENDRRKTWKKYITDNRLEITCGEAPYLVSRYDTTTGEYIPINQRIGLLDRKLRVISENTDNTKDWLYMARKAYQHIYGYEWQGDNLLLAREALFLTFIEYYIDKFNKYEDFDDDGYPKNIPDKKSLIGIARIISWNLWQMDGIKMVVPDSCDKVYEQQLFDIVKKDCPACKSGDLLGHIGDYCLIRDWEKKKPKDYIFKSGEDPDSSPWQKIYFQSLLRNN